MCCPCQKWYQYPTQNWKVSELSRSHPVKQLLVGIQASVMGAVVWEPSPDPGCAVVQSTCQTPRFDIFFPRLTFLVSLGCSHLVHYDPASEVTGLDLVLS